MTVFCLQMTPFLGKPKRLCALTRLLIADEMNSATGADPTFLSCYPCRGQICVFISSGPTSEEHSWANPQENKAENSTTVKPAPVLCSRWRPRPDPQFSVILTFRSFDHGRLLPAASNDQNANHSCCIMASWSVTEQVHRTQQESYEIIASSDLSPLSKYTS